MRAFVRGSKVAAIFLIAVTVSLGWASPARADDRGWTRLYGTPLDDAAQGVSTDGRAVYAYGLTGGVLPGQQGLGNQDVYLRKFDREGNHVWTRQFGTTELDNPFFGNVVAHKGRVIVAGSVNGTLPGQTPAGGDDAFLRAYDSDGNVLWTRQYGTSFHDAVRNVAIDRHGFIYVAAQTNGALPGQTNFGDRDAVVQKFDPEGNMIWTVQFGSAAFEEAIGVTVHGQHVYATGVTRGVLPGQTTFDGTDGFVIKLTADYGHILWLKQFGSGGNDSPWKVRVIGDSIFVSGHTTGNFGAPNAGSTDPFLLKLGPDGEIQWVRQFGTPGQDFSFPMTVHQGGIVMAGVVRGTLPGQPPSGDDGDFWIRKYSADGDELWTRQWGTTVLDSLTAIAAKGHALYVSGGSRGNLDGQTNAGMLDAVVIRVPDMGDDEDEDGANEEDD